MCWKSGGSGFNVTASEAWEMPIPELFEWVEAREEMMDAEQAAIDAASR